VALDPHRARELLVAGHVRVECGFRIGSQARHVEVELHGHRSAGRLEGAHRETGPERGRLAAGVRDLHVVDPGRQRRDGDVERIGALEHDARARGLGGPLNTTVAPSSKALPNTLAFVGASGAIVDGEMDVTCNRISTGC
jgi:hypothetical protein